ncbi:helix-turn-helix domain-containing protein [Ruminococcus sp. Marseille-P6503]|uniref:helix-turn-helix domain-containing protein n=1 Tax=Ruminococcus sp. Marseille-P6503 TaxID=2364796 RepID=UPI000F549653|nr:helix-turn-helix domain-containing protein [Ruminococcus sp. Marseille-P6503]
MNYISGKTIKDLRERKSLTQKQLAQRLMVSDKTVSKWETGRGLPDITMIEPLARELQVSVAELLAGEWSENSNRSANMLKGRFYVCPMCGNIIFSCGEGSFSCCGITLPPLEPEERDSSHFISAEQIEYEHYITLEHPMEKDHYISFIACVTDSDVCIVKLYPEQNPGARFKMRGSCAVFAYCNRHGLYKIKL